MWVLVVAKKNSISKAMAASVAAAGTGHGNRIEARDPERAVKALEMLADGKSYREIKRTLHMDWDTMITLRSRHHATLEQRRMQLAQDALEIGEGLRLLQRQKMQDLADNPEQLEKTNIRDLTLPWGIAHTKYMEAVGENKVVIEHRTGAPSLEDAMKAIEAAKQKFKDGSIAIDVTPKE
jgi:hypothetical protein